MLNSTSYLAMPAPNTPFLSYIDTLHGIFAILHFVHGK